MNVADVNGDGERPRSTVRRVTPSVVPVQPTRKAAEVIADHLRRDIAMGALRDGDTLPPEGELIAHFGVSRPTLRSALRMLESESLLTISRGSQGGPQVRHPDIDVTARSVAMLLQLRGTLLSDFFAVRSVIEPAAVVQIARLQPEDGIARLRALLEAESAAVVHGDADAFLMAAVDFYRTITDCCGSDLFAVIGAVLQTLLIRASEYLRQTVDNIGARLPPTDLLDAHARLLELIEEGDAAAAEVHWKRHIDDLAAAFPELQTVRFTAY